MKFEDRKTLRLRLPPPTFKRFLYYTVFKVAPVQDELSWVCDAFFGDEHVHRAQAATPEAALAEVQRMENER